MAYGDFKDLNKRIAADNVLHDETFNTGKNPKYDEYRRGLASMVHKFTNKTTLGGATIKYKIRSKKELAEELH